MESFIFSRSNQEFAIGRLFFSFTQYTVVSIYLLLQEVSDRVEKAETADHVLWELEHDSEKIVKYDWRSHIHEEVASDLKKYRSYYGNSVRDLLRALRNKVCNTFLIIYFSLGNSYKCMQKLFRFSPIYYKS